MEACVVLGDVVGSRELSDREAFRESLLEGCRSVNEAFAEHVVADAKLLKGVDELGVVVDDRRITYDLVKRLLDAVHPSGIRFGVAEGRIDVGTASTDVTAMDGPAFHRADRLLSDLEEGGLVFDADFGRPTVDRAIADEINLLLRWRTRLTPRQFEYLRAYERRGSQQSAAEVLDVTQQAVSKELRRMDRPFVSEIESRLEETLGEYDTAG